MGRVLWFVCLILGVASSLGQNVAIPVLGATWVMPDGTAVVFGSLQNGYIGANAVPDGGGGGWWVGYSVTTFGDGSGSAPPGGMYIEHDLANGSYTGNNYYLQNGVLSFANSYSPALGYGSTPYWAGYGFGSGSGGGSGLDGVVVGAFSSVMSNNWWVLMIAICVAFFLYQLGSRALGRA